MNDEFHNIDMTRVPRHVAIIMDGNGRWAKAQGMQRSEGHVEGVNTVRRITEVASEMGVKFLTLYTFSTENWNRPQQEVDLLMHLIVTAIERETPDLIKNNVKLGMIGDFSRMPQFALERLQQCMQQTSHCTGLNLVLALSYSSRWEITEAMRRIAAKVADGSIRPECIDDTMVSENLATSWIPDPDLLIRTGGDIRVSNYLLWQIAYSELYFTNTYWPDFGRKAFIDAVVEFQTRERRYGLTSEQINSHD